MYTVKNKSISKVLVLTHYCCWILDMPDSYISCAFNIIKCVSWCCVINKWIELNLHECKISYLVKVFFITNSWTKKERKTHEVDSERHSIWGCSFFPFKHFCTQDECMFFNLAFFSSFIYYMTANVKHFDQSRGSKREIGIVCVCVYFVCVERQTERDKECVWVCVLKRVRERKSGKEVLWKMFQRQLSY